MADHNHRGSEPTALPCLACWEEQVDIHVSCKARLVTLAAALREIHTLASKRLHTEAAAVALAALDAARAG